MRKWFLVCALAVTTASIAYAETWHTWRGDHVNGVYEGNPPLEWSESKNVRWKTAIPGSGYATPILHGDRLYVQTAVPADGGKNDYRILAIDRATGKTEWSKSLRVAAPVEARNHRTASAASTSGVTDGEHLYAYFGSQGLYCLDFEGNVKWEKDLGDMRTRNSFGEGSSPAIYGDRIVVNWDHEGDSFIVALDKRTGKELWRNARHEVSTWVTPLIVKHGDKVHVIVSASHQSVGYDLATGEEIWSCEGLGTNVSPTPMYKDGVVYVLSGHRSPAMQAIDLDKADGDVTGTDAVLWSITQNTPYVATPLLYDGHIFLTKNRNAILSCYDAETGKVIFGPERLPGMAHIYSPIVGAQGRVYVADLDGNTRVFKNANEMVVLATNTLDEGTASNLTIDGDRIYFRGYNHLYCIGE